MEGIPKVSVVITTYNRPEYLRRVVEGYLNQSHPPDEILIAEDGSNRETELTVGELQTKSNVKILHIRQEHNGFRAAMIRNKAIASSTGSYIILSDDDSIPCRTLVKDHLCYAERGYFIQGHRVLLGEKVSNNFTFWDISIKKLFLSFIKGQVKNFSNAIRLPIPLIMISQSLEGIRSCNMSFFKKDFVSINGFNEDFIGWGKEDSELVVRFYKYGLKRKDIRFHASSYHLYHFHYERSNLEKNILLLERSINEKDYYCKNGIDKYLKAK